MWRYFVLIFLLSACGDDASKIKKLPDELPDMGHPDASEQEMGEDPCSRISCGFGTCVSTGTSAYCECNSGFVFDGTTCVAGPTNPSLVVNLTGPDFTTEAGGSTSFTIALSHQPNFEVRVPLSLSRPQEADLSTVSLTFGENNWNSPQTVIVTGKDDSTPDGDQTYLVRIGPTTSADGTFNRLETSITLTSIDGVCGNGVVDANEDCDQPGAPQECAYGEMSCTVCSDTCELIPGQLAGYCGNGIVEGPEACDQPGASQICPAGQSTCTVCNSQCELVPGQPNDLCGNGVVDNSEDCDQPGASQECAYGSMSCTVCNPQCELVAGQVTGYCGNGTIEGPEDCDQPGASQQCAYGSMSCTVCNSSCQLVSGQVSGFCGNGIVEGPEDCDEPGAIQDCEYGEMSCSVCSNTCELVPGQVNGYCGDGVIQVTHEECDGVDLGGVSCPATQTGSVLCTATCEVDDSACENRVRKIASGSQHHCALLFDGTVKCWGRNSSYQLGDGTDIDRNTPVSALGITDAVDIDSGVNHTCVVRANGAVRCWGTNGSGQLGGGNTFEQTGMVDVLNITDALSVSTGNAHTCVARTNGLMSCWGNNVEGQIGVGNLAGPILTPIDVGGIDNVVEVALGAAHTCARRQDGGVRCWGYNFDGQLGDGTRVTRRTPPQTNSMTGAAQIDAGDFFSCARLQSGSVNCWGRNASGQIGDGSNATRQTSPSSVTGISTAVDLTTGLAHGCVALSNGSMRCWGSNAGGKLGDGTTNDSNTPVVVTTLNDAIQASGGGGSTCALLAGGAIYCWGANSSGQLGDGTNAPSLTPTASNPP